MTQSFESLLADIPAAPRISAADVAAARTAANERTIYVVLDDDPTGTQSVADLPVLTAWEPEDFRWAFGTGKPAVYVMTNSRSLAPADAERVNREVVAAAVEAADGHPLAFISRSDSTLRGHFPLEPFTIADELRRAGGQQIDGIVLVPAFGDAGRITIHGTHYAGSRADGFVPVGQSEFARDATFGYRSSALPQWIEEKSQGVLRSDDVLTIDLTTLRTDHATTVTVLRSAKDSQMIVPDIVEEEDLRLLSLALIEAEAQGSTFLYRVGPPFPRARIGQDIHSPVSEAEIRATRSAAGAKGGLIVVGSHVALTTRQLEQLRDSSHPKELELSVSKIVDPQAREEHVAQVAAEAAAALHEGNVVVRTSRELVTGADGDASLNISRQVSAAVVETVRQILAANPPRFVVAKGGITSSDVATKGLQFRHARVVGPMLPGIVSLWSGEDGPAAGIPYVVFAGNVGGPESLDAVVSKLTNA